MSRLLRVLAPVFLLAAAPAWAEGFDFASRAADGPVTVEAAEGIEWRQDQKLFIARGRAKAARGGVTVTADTLTAHYREQNGQTDIWRLDAQGSVVIATATETATGTFATYDIDSARLLITGRPRLVTPTDTVTASDSLEYGERTQTAVAKGDAVATRADRRIRADVLTARFRTDKSGRMVLGKADAQGGVVLTTQRDVVTGDKGTYDAESGIATMTGSVKITRDENQLNGGYAQVNLETGISKLFAAPPGAGGGTQRVQGLFQPERKSGPDDGKAAAGGR